MTDYFELYPNDQSDPNQYPPPADFYTQQHQQYYQQHYEFDAPKVEPVSGECEFLEEKF